MNKLLSYTWRVAVSLCHPWENWEISNPKHFLQGLILCRIPSWERLVIYITQAISVTPLVFTLMPHPCFSTYPEVVGVFRVMGFPLCRHKGGLKPEALFNKLPPSICLKSDSSFCHFAFFVSMPLLFGFMDLKHLFP